MALTVAFEDKKNYEWLPFSISFAEVTMDFSAALCAVGLWGRGGKETAGSGQTCAVLCLCHGMLCLASARGVPQSRFASCVEACGVVVLAPLRADEIPAAAFEAGFKHLLPHAEPELNPDGPSLAVYLRPSPLLSPSL